jgi:capsular polysaccharide biosynthesis protein
MPRNTLLENESAVLVHESLSRRKLPVNFRSDDLALFSHELEQLIPATTLLQFEDVRVSSDGILFKHNHMLPESFAFPFNMDQWKRRSILKFFVSNYVLRRSRKVERDVLWIIDDWSTGYFHWLTDALTRLYVMRDRLDDFVLLLPWDYEARDFAQSSLRPFNVKAVEFIGQNEVLRCHRLFMPTHTAPSGQYNEEIIRGVRDLLLQAYGDPGYTGEGGRIYISRGRARKRRILNEDEVSNVLAEFGFQTIYAEDLSFAQQVEISSQARYLVSNHGAGMTNMLFMPEGSNVLELRHREDCINNCYFTLSSALNLNYFYQTCPSSSDLQDPHAADLLVDANALRTNLTLMLAFSSEPPR